MFELARLLFGIEVMVNVRRGDYLKSEWSALY